MSVDIEVIATSQMAIAWSPVDAAPHIAFKSGYSSLRLKQVGRRRAEIPFGSASLPLAKFRLLWQVKLQTLRSLRQRATVSASHRRIRGLCKMRGGLGAALTPPTGGRLPPRRPRIVLGGGRGKPAGRQACVACSEGNLQGSGSSSLVALGG
jgi:hypothetical protein